MTPGALLLFAAVSLAAGIVSGPWFSRTWLAVTLAGATAGLTAALSVLFGATDWEWRSALSLGGELVHLRLDGLSAMFLALLCVVCGAGAVYASEYWSEVHYPASAPRGRVWWSALGLNMGLVLTLSNGLHFLIAWELFTVSAFFLVTLDRQRPEVRAAGWLYLVASHAGTVCLFAFFSTLAARTGSWELGPMREQVALAPLFWLALGGFGVKAGMFPLHVWLPSAHANAPSHVSAIMSGVAIKMGLYGIVRFSGWLPVPPAAGWVVIGFGATSALLGITFAFAQNDFKRLLAYSSVENMGVILIGLGGALLAVTHGDALWGRLALAGALLHVWNHGAFKSLLFFWRRFSVARHGHAGDEQARWIVAHDAVDRRVVRARLARCFSSAATQWICQRMVGVPRTIRRGDKQGHLSLGRHASSDHACDGRGLGDGEFCEGWRHDFPRGASDTGCNPRARMWNGNARTDARIGGPVRSNRPRSNFILAGNRARGGKLASGMDCGGITGATGEVGLGSPRTGESGSDRGDAVVAKGAREQPASQFDLGLRLCVASRPNAIHQCFIRWNRRGLASMRAATRS